MLSFAKFWVREAVVVLVGEQMEQFKGFAMLHDEASQVSVEMTLKATSLRHIILGEFNKNYLYSQRDPRKCTLDPYHCINDLVDSIRPLQIVKISRGPFHPEAHCVFMGHIFINLLAKS